MLGCCGQPKVKHELTTEHPVCPNWGQYMPPRYRTGDRLICNSFCTISASLVPNLGCFGPIDLSDAGRYLVLLIEDNDQYERRRPMLHLAAIINKHSTRILTYRYCPRGDRCLECSNTAASYTPLKSPKGIGLVNISTHRSSRVEVTQTQPRH